MSDQFQRHMLSAERGIEKALESLRLAELYEPAVDHEGGEFPLRRIRDDLFAVAEHIYAKTRVDDA